MKRILFNIYLCFPDGSEGKIMSAIQETQVRFLGEDSLKKEMETHTSVFLPGESHGQRSLVGYSPWGRKESDTTEQLTHTYTHLFI